MKLHSFISGLHTRLSRPGFWLVLALSVVGMLVSGVLWMEPAMAEGLPMMNSTPAPGGGNNYIYLIPGSVLAGAALLLLSDLAARVIIMPVILPIGALTAFLGGPLFLYLLFKGRGRT